MLDTLTYINHLNEAVTFGVGDILIDKNDVRDYEWSYNPQYNRILGFKRQITKKTLPVLIYGANRNETANRLFEIIEKDVLANQSGRLYSGNYYLSGFFYGSRKESYNDARFLRTKLTFVTTQTRWIYSKTYVFRTWDGGEDTGFDYPHDYPIAYGSPISIQNLTNTGFVPSNFLIRVYGPVQNPSVIIGGDVHRVYCTLMASEYLEIDSINKTIIKTAANGNKSNQFLHRDLDHYVFEKIKSGVNTVSVVPPCSVDITILEERSEPAWT